MAPLLSFTTTAGLLCVVLLDALNVYSCRVSCPYGKLRFVCSPWGAICCAVRHREVRRYAIILASINGAHRQGFALGKIENELSNVVISPAEVRRLREENARLRSLLIEHGLQIPEIPFTTGVSRTTNTLSAPSQSALGKAEQRIALFRSLFRGRDDVYAIRWESADGRSGYMPKADRDWKSYLRAKDEERKKVDRQTRKFRPLTDDVVRAHLVGEHTVGIYPPPNGRDLLAAGGRF